MLEQVRSKVDDTIASGLGTNIRASPQQRFSSEHTIKLRGEAFILAIEKANFTSTNANITSRHINSWTNVTGKFGHEGLTKSHNFGIRFAPRVKIGSAFATTNLKTSQRIFQNLFKTKKLDDGKIYRGMKTQASFVRTASVVVLHTKSSIRVDTTLIIAPYDTKLNSTIRFDHTFKNFKVFSFFFENGDQRVCDFLHCLEKFALVGITIFNRLK
mmetsp:Transcript_7605/g.11515  ORF Transcript_7605/g.11515 Transcript_7605/m.11515 type:complete len:214 (+) Transcript_7605:768-1409(+)